MKYPTAWAPYPFCRIYLSISLNLWTQPSNWIRLGAWAFTARWTAGSASLMTMGNLYLASAGISQSTRAQNRE